MTVTLNTASLVSELRWQAPRLEKALRVEPPLTLDESNLMRRAADALESTSRALSEKEGECKRSELGRHRLGHELREATRQRDEALAALKASREALEPFARIAEEYADQEDDDFQVWRDFDVLGATLPLRIFRCALSALESSPAALADATKKEPGTEQREAGRG